jgi:hypothetical protein
MANRYSNVFEKHSLSGIVHWQKSSLFQNSEGNLFSDKNWNELHVQGYTLVRNQIGSTELAAAQNAAEELNQMHPGGGWESVSTDGLWRQISQCTHASFMRIATDVLDRLASEIIETAPTLDDVQLASVPINFESKEGRKFHIDGGDKRSLGVFNVLFGVALTPVSLETDGGFRVLPASHHTFAGAFQNSHPIPHWGQSKRFWVGALGRLLHAQMIVPLLVPGDIIVAHSFLAHGTSSNTSNRRRDMIFQRRAAAPLWDADTRERAREVFMRDCWAFFKRRPEQLFT